MGVRVRRHKGSWYVFINPLKRRKAKKIGPGEAGKRLAMQVAGKIRTHLTHGEDIDGPRDIPTLEDYAHLWLQSVSGLKKTGTYKSYQRHMRRMWLPALGRYRLDQLTRSHIKKVLVDLQQQYQYSRHHMLSIPTMMQSCLGEAVDEELIDTNVASRQTRNISRTPPKEIDVFTDPELRTLLQTASQYSLTCYLMILIMPRTGMREGKMLTLPIDDIDLERSRITIRRTWGSRNARKNLTCISRPKSGKSRQVDISPQLHATLRDYPNRTSLQGPWLCPDGNGPSLPMTPNALAWHWRRILKLASLRHRGPHTLRHTYASFKLAHGEDLTYISSQLGHSSARIALDVYAHFLPKAAQLGVAKLDDAHWQTAPNERLQCNPRVTSA